MEQFPAVVSDLAQAFTALMLGVGMIAFIGLILTASAAFYGRRH